MIARAALSVVVFLVGCGRDYEPEPIGGGPCVITYAEPILTFQSAVSRPSGAAISQITLTDFSIDGEPKDPLAYWGATPQGSFNVSISEDGVHCTIPCGFSMQPGLYEFKASTPDHQDSPLEVDAAYDSYQGSCPAVYDEGVDVNVELMQASQR